MGRRSPSGGLWLGDFSSIAKDGVEGVKIVPLMNWFQKHARSRSCRNPLGLGRFTAPAVDWRVLITALFHTAVSSALPQVPTPSAEPATLLTNIQQVLALGNAALQTNPLPVRLRGVLTAISREDHLLFLQDDPFALSAQLRGGTEGYAPGQLLEVEGVAVASPVQPRIQAENARVIRTARLPGLKWGDVYRITLGDYASRSLLVRGVIRDLLLENEQLVFLVRHGGLHFRVIAPAPPGTVLPRDLIDAEIDVEGACLHITDAQGAIRGFNLMMPGTNYFKLQRPGTTNLFERPLTTIAEFHSRRADPYMRDQDRRNRPGPFPG